MRLCCTVCASGTPVGRAHGARDWAMLALLERHGGVVYAANAGYHRDTDLARRLFADQDAGRLREGTVHPGTTLAEDLLGSAATGGDPEIVQMDLARIDWPRDDSRWYWKLGDPLCFWNHMPGMPTGNATLDRRTYFTCFLLILERCDPNVRPWHLVEPFCTRWRPCAIMSRTMRWSRSPQRCWTLEHDWMCVTIY